MKTLKLMMATATALAGLWGAAAPAQAQQLVVATFGGKSPEHMREHIFDAFAADTGIKVEQVIVPGKMLAGMQAQQETGNVQWDLTTSISASDFATMSARGYLADLPADVRTILEKDYAVVRPNGFANKRGALLIVCNKKAVDACPTTAAEFLDVDKFPGTRFMPSFQFLEALAFGAYASGVPADKVFPLDLDRAIAALEKLRPTIAQFYDNSTTARQLLSSGEVQMGLLWNGIPPQILGEGNVNVDLAVSWDGAVTYNQYTVVYKNSPNQDSAWTFLKWLDAHPDNLAAFANADGTDTANKAAFALQSPEIQAWSPESDHGATTVEVDTEWYMGAGEIKDRIDAFWKSYIN